MTCDVNELKYSSIEVIKVIKTYQFLQLDCPHELEIDVTIVTICDVEFLRFSFIVPNLGDQESRSQSRKYY